MVGCVRTIRGGSSFSRSFFLGRYCGMLWGFADKYGPQFAPAPLLQDMAKSGKKFHK